MTAHNFAERAMHYTIPDAAAAFEPVNDDIRARAHYDIGYPHDPEREREHEKRLMVMRAAMQPAHRPEAPRFSLVRYLQRIASNAPIDPIERVTLEQTAETIKQPFDRNRVWLGWGQMQRAMTAVPGAKGGYLVGTEQMEPVDILRGASIVASAGVQTPTGFTGSITLPVAKTAPVASFVGEGVAPSSNTEPVFGQGSATPKTIVAVVPVSHQLLRQCDERANRFVISLVARAVAQAFDRAVLAGAGGVEPLGLFATSGVNVQSGSTLGNAGLLSMRRKAVEAGADDDALMWLGAPDVLETLGGRQRFTGASTTCWDADGIQGKRSVATKNAPSGTLACGNFADIVAPIFGPGVRLDVDPSTLWNSGGIQIRALLFADVIVTHPAAFSVASSIT